MTRLTESAEVREALAHALRLDLIGPWAGHALADERLRGWERPSNWYLTGFLVPRGAPVQQRGDADVDDEPEEAERARLGDDSTEDRRAAKKGFFPSSMGLSFLVSAGVDTLEVLVRWGDYRRVEAESGDPNRDRAEQGDEAEAERDQRETPAERRGDATGRLGEWPFEIGLWVGKAGTPNHLGEKGDGRSDSAREGEPVQEQPARQADAHPDGELSVVRGGFHPGLHRAAAECADAGRSAHRVRELAVRVLRRPSAPHRRGGRAALPASARVPDRH